MSVVLGHIPILLEGGGGELTPRLVRASRKPGRGRATCSTSATIGLSESGAGMLPGTAHAR
jgi:hypothetical protein